MKKTLLLLLTLLMLGTFTATAVAKPDNSNNQAKNQVKNKTAYTQQDKFSGKKNFKAAQIKKENKLIKKQLKAAIKAEWRNTYKLNKNNHRPAKKVFSDTYQHWAKNCIAEMADLGLLKGYPDGSFKPNQELSQAEALSLVMRLAADAADVTIKDDKDIADVPEWVKKDVNKALKKGIININRFHSAVQASRAQTAVMIAKALDLDPVDTSDIPFKDGIYISPQDLGYILALYQEGIISGTPNGNFNPNSCITRAEMASILQRILEKAEEDSTISDIEEAWEDEFADAGIDYFRDGDLIVKAINLNGDEDELNYTIKLDISESDKYDHLQDIDEDDTEDFLIAVRTFLKDEIKDTEYEDAVINGQLIDKNSSDTYVTDKDGTFTFMLSEEVFIDNLKETLEKFFANAGKTYFDDAGIEVASIKLSVDADSLNYLVKLDFADADNNYTDLEDVDKNDLEELLDDLRQIVADKTDNTNYEYVDINGKITDNDDAGLYVKDRDGSFSYSWK